MTFVSMRDPAKKPSYADVLFVPIPYPRMRPLKHCVPVKIEKTMHEALGFASARPAHFAPIESSPQDAFSVIDTDPKQLRAIVRTPDRDASPQARPLLSSAGW